MISNEIILKAKQLFASGLSHRAIAKQLNVDHATVGYWVKHNFRLHKLNEIVIANIPPDTYSYVLGLYLGDGYIDKTSRTYRLRITCDAKYPKLIEECKEQLKILFPNNSIHTVNAYHNGLLSSINVGVYSILLPQFFPQHGAGKKHLRSILLTDWQKEIIQPEQILRGLFHSDGSYYAQTMGKYRYHYYQFTNYSEDIRNIWKYYCDKLNIKYTEDWKNVKHTNKQSCGQLLPILGIKQ